MHIKGWAFKENYVELSKKCMDRYNEIKHMRGIISKVSPQYGQTCYYGNLGEYTLTKEDIAILCDEGNVCFGASVEINSNKDFYCIIYTD